MDEFLSRAIQHAARLPAHLQRQCGIELHRFIALTYRLSAQNDGAEIEGMDEVLKRVGEPRLVDAQRNLVDEL